MIIDLKSFKKYDFTNVKKDIIDKDVLEFKSFCEYCENIIDENENEIIEYFDNFIKNLKESDKIKNIYYSEYNDYIYDSYLYSKNIKIDGCFVCAINKKSFYRIKKEDVLKKLINNRIRKIKKEYLK